MDQKWTYFNLAQITLRELSDEELKQIDSQNWPFAVEIQDDDGKPLIGASIEYLDTVQTCGALHSYVDSDGWGSVFDGFKPALIAYFEQQRVALDDRWKGITTCMVGIETTFSKSYYYSVGGYEYDAHAWITGIIDTSGWNTESFTYTTKHPDWVESK